MARLTPEEIQTVNSEIESFKANALKFAGSSTVLASHYNRLYKASKTVLKRVAREQQVKADQEFTEKLKDARKSGASANKSNAETRRSA